MLSSTHFLTALALIVLLIALVSTPGVAADSLSDGLVAYWSFDGDVSATEGGSGYDAVVHNGPLSFEAGRFGLAARFTRSLSQYLDVTSPVITQGEDHSYSAWYTCDVEDIVGTSRYFVLETRNASYSSAYSASYGLRDISGEDNGQVYTQWAGGSAAHEVPGGAGTDWHNIIVTYDADSTGAEHSIYLDGVFVDDMASTDQLVDTAGLIIGGHRTGTGRNWDGLIDDVAFWDRVITTGEIAAIQIRSVGVPFTDIGAGLEGVDGASAAWGDYDNDGDLDVLITGYVGSGRTSRIYENDAGVFTDTGAGLEGVNHGSAAWGDYDNDGDLDVLLTGRTSSGRISRIYDNDAGNFSDIGPGLEAVDFSSAAWGDYDNDGDLDVLLSGSTDSGRISRVYENDAGTFTGIEAGLEGLSSNSVAWGDYDSDGDLDILLTGWTGSEAVSRVYDSDTGTFTDIEAGLMGVSNGSAAWGDYDNDGDLDILLSGSTGSEHISRVYENDAGTFTDIEAGLEGVTYSSAAWGDYDNDGDLDILLTGYMGPGHISRVYDNDAGAFTDIRAGLEGASHGSAAWGDYDNDGDLDVLLTGYTPGSGRISRVYENNEASANTRPAAPSNLSFDLTDNVATFSWDAATDDETPADGLTYNLRVGTTPGGEEICSCMADGASGYRRVARLGNVNHNTTWTITVPDSLSPWAYWSVQAVDNAFEGSAFAPEQHHVPFTDIGAGLEGVAYSSAAWGDYDNDGDLDVLVTGYTGSYERISYIYENNGGVFTDIEAGLEGVSKSSAAWGDYDNDGDLDILITGYVGSGRISRVYENDAGVFTDIGAGLEGVCEGSAAWGDYDNDGDLDILITGDTGSGDNGPSYISRVYENDAGAFTDIGAGLEVVLYGSAAWGDYDNDGDLDVLITGEGGVGRISRVYENDADVFTDIGAGLMGVSNGSAAWGDYDNDGDLDILITGCGYTSSEFISRVYENDAGVFTDIGAELMGVSNGSAAWGDYDNDGDLDILITGHTGVARSSRVYDNDAGTFTDIRAELEEVSSSSTAWGDYDNDGDLDILLTGSVYPVSGPICIVYRNDEAASNTPPAAPSNLSFDLTGNIGTFSWDAATDSETPADGLTYNLRVGTTPGGNEICSCMADGASGYRRVAQLGNVNHNTTWSITLPDSLPPSIHWSVQSLDSAFEGSTFATTETGVPEADDRPLVLRLYPSSPNPFNPRTVVRYDLPAEAPVRISIYDVAGRLVRTLVDVPAQEAGRHSAVWDGRNDGGQSVASAIYFCHMESGDFRQDRKMALIR